MAWGTIPYYHGKRCGACGTTKRRKSDRRCLHCEYWDALQIFNRYRFGESGLAGKQISVAAKRKYAVALELIMRHGVNQRYRETGRRGSNMRRGRKLDAPGHFTTSQVRSILIWQGGGCAYCGETENLHLDHIVPLSRPGTSNWPWNLQWLCAHHNLSKNDRTDAEYRLLIDLPAAVPISRALFQAVFPMILLP